jgi:hypothetical protein
MLILSITQIYEPCSANEKTVYSAAALFLWLLWDAGMA